MKKKTISSQNYKLENALDNLLRYLHFLENLLFVLFFVTLFGAGLTVLLSIIYRDFDLFQLGLIIILITVTVYIFIIKPLFLIIYAVSKILINIENHTDLESYSKGQ